MKRYVFGVLAIAMLLGSAGSAAASDIEPPACNDGIDNDGAGKVDYPNDSDCTAPEDDSEIVDDPPAVCSDGLDNDGDGLTDHPEDGGCSFAGDDDEMEEPHSDVRYARTLTLTNFRHVNFSGKREILVKGVVQTPAREAEECDSEVPVKIQIRRDGVWVTRKNGVTATDGSFEILVRDARGRYRAVATKVVVYPDPETFGECLRAEDTQWHAHSGS